MNRTNKSSSVVLLLVLLLGIGSMMAPLGAVLAEPPDPRPASAAPTGGEGDPAPQEADGPLQVEVLAMASSTSSCVALFQDGGDRLVALQNDDGGWDWPLDDGNPGNASPRNTVGPIAMGLAQAYLHTEDSTHLTALVDAGGLLLSKTNNFSPSDGYLAAELDSILGGTAYVDHVTANFYGPLAAGTYDRNGAGTLYSTAGYVSLIRTARANQGIANLAAWDIGMGLVGAAAAGADTTAWVDGVKAEIDELDGNAYYDVIGLAGAVYGLAYVGEDFDPTAGEHAAASNLTDLAGILASYQIAGGGFTWNMNYTAPGNDDETIQETAYATLALDEFDRSTYLSAIQGAVGYMESVQLATGGWKNWTGGGENNEVTGEALWAISAGLPGPATSNVLANPNPAEVNNSVQVIALVDNTNRGCSNIASAEYSLDGGAWTGMSAVDGGFDEVGEDVAADLDAPSVAGIYNLCVRGTDTPDNVGDPECIMLVVYDPDGGFVTGGGWIDSPSGAYMPDIYKPGPDTVVVTPHNVGVDWFSPDIRGDGSIDIVEGPQPSPLGTGSLQMGTGSSSDKAQLFNYDHIGTLLADVDGISYATYRDSSSTNPPAQYPAINMEVDYIGDGSSYTTLVWEPIYSYGQANLALDTWQTWDTMAPSQTGFGGGWWSTRDIPGVCPFNCFVDWDTIVQNNPNAKISGAFGVNVGSGWNGVFTGAVDALMLIVNADVVVYDFEPVAPPPDLTGKANFGFVSKYKKGAGVPTGNTEFQFQAADLNFHSDNYEWLVVNQAGTNAQFKGMGTINGMGDYKFMLWAGDGDPDTFRIKIWWEEGDGENVVYDNGMDQPIGGGSIVVHTK